MSPQLNVNMNVQLNVGDKRRRKEGVDLHHFLGGEGD